MDPTIERYISLIDMNGIHRWIPGPLPPLPLFKLRFQIQSNFIKSREGRVTFLSALGRFSREVEQVYQNFGRCVMRFWIEPYGSGVTLYGIEAYDWQQCKPYLYYLGECMLAQRATERALRKQGRIHKDVISIVGQHVWASRWHGEWMLKLK